jgi:exosortase/archaeosortase family protein
VSLISPSSDAVTASGGILHALQKSFPRGEFFAGLFLIGCANGLGSNIIPALSSGDWTGGLQNISAIVWFACFVGISFLLRDKTDSIKTADLAVGVVFVALCLAPAAEMNWIAVTGLSLYMLLFTKDASARKLLLADTDSERRRAAIVMLALTVPMLWSRLLFSFIAKVFLEFDATLVGWLLRTERTGNVIRFADQSGDMVILPACSSLANVSLAFLCWVVITQWVKHRRSREDILWCFLACASVVVVNVGRIAIMGLGQWYYQTFHYGWGSALTNAIILVLIIGFSVVGVRRELFPRV